jgi:cytochrome P450
MQKDWETYSHQSIVIPANPSPALPVESDPPRHTALRAIISPLFTPITLKKVEVQARQLCAEMVNELQPKGECEFQQDFALRLPITIFLTLVNLPLDDREMLLELAEVRVSSPSPEAREAAKQRLLAYLGEVVERRRSFPGDDFISHVVHAKVEGEPISDSDLRNMLSTIMFGGLHTVASMLGFIMHFLARSEIHRQQLVRDNSIIPKAVDELIRRNGVSNTSRVVMRDVSRDGVTLKPGDRITLPNSLVGLDDERFPHSLEVDFNRTNAHQHAAFGNGPHRCPGANTARLEIRIVLEEWLRRIPDFRVSAHSPVVVSSGQVNSMRALPLEWTK